MEELTIASEADAWKALERAASGEKFPANVRLKFDGWPTFQLDYRGHDWHSSVPTRVMSPLLDLQRDINRAFVSVQYDEPNLRKLRDEDRDKLEVVVKVEKGSSIFSADLWKQFTHIADTLVGKMDGNQIVFTVISIAVATASTVMFRAWLAARQKAKELDNRLELSKEETERQRIFAAAMLAKPELAHINDAAQATNSELLRAAKPEDDVKFGGVNLRGYEAHAVVQTERERAKDIEIDGVFAILANRTDQTAGFRIKVRRVRDDLVFSADVPVELPYDQQRLIEQAEWTKSLVNLTISASRLRGVISAAKVESASRYGNDTAPVAVASVNSETLRSNR